MFGDSRPMRLGVLSDIHADAASLHRALDHLATMRVDRVVALGDLVEKGPDGDEVVATLHRALIPSVRGNHDDNAVRHAALGGVPDERCPPLTKATLTMLAALPLSREYLWASRRVHLAHGVPGDNTTYLFADQAPSKLFKRSLKRLGDVDVLLLGHTHRPMRARKGRLHVVNPGSVTRRGKRTSHTFGVLSLPAIDFRVYDVTTGVEREVEEAEWS